MVCSFPETFVLGRAVDVDMYTTDYEDDAQCTFYTIELL